MFVCVKVLTAAMFTIL